MKRNSILLTGLRLVLILNILYFGDYNKEEIKQILKDKYSLDDISNETLKLDINSLIARGFKIKRGNRTNNYKYHLEIEPSLFKFNDFETEIINLVKEIVVSTADFKDVVLLKRFYFKIKNLFSDKYKEKLLDFKHFNFLNPDLSDKIDFIIKSNFISRIVYNGSKNHKRERIVYIDRISYRNNKLYLDAVNVETKRLTTFRADRVESIEILENYKTNFNKTRKEFIYKIDKDFYMNNLTEKFERIVSIDSEGVYVAADEVDKFFVIQRILMLGKNCIEIKDEELKKEVIENIRAIREIYLTK